MKATSDSRFDQDIQAVRDRTAALIEEQQITSLTYRDQERRRMALDLEQTALADLREEARRKGQTDLENIQLSEQQRAKIAAVSAAYGEQADQLRRVQEAQDRADRSSEEFYDTFKSSTIDAITGAESLADALANVAKKLGDLLLNNALDALFAPQTSNSSGGTFGSIFSSIGKWLGLAKGGPVKAATGGRISGNRHERQRPCHAFRWRVCRERQATEQNRALLDAINSGKSLAWQQAARFVLRRCRA
ncbi:hypothetical protein AJ87_05810 [Rhizobium yanglingense]|nr:hypothetical protein AJ87_05810 [Rhizobium yanglingense]